MERMASLRHWLESVLGPAAFGLSPASNDASFRRYFRVRFEDGRPSLIAMDAPPGREDCRPYVNVAALFAAAGVHVPAVQASNLDQGFLLLSDLGNTTYLAALGEAEDSADRLYGDALDALVRIQLASRPGALPEYSRELLARELALFPDWYVARQLGRELTAAQRQAIEESFALLLANNLAQPRVFVHRDYHSRNLMLAEPNPGILDFQDAVYGPLTYDLVSLLRDAYISWPEERIIDWCVRYWEKARSAGLPVAADFSAFYRDFEWMGAQRQIKVLGIFARLCYRDGKEGYLGDQPLVMRYLRGACGRYRELGPLARLLEQLEPAERTVGHTF
ncbi:MAG: aminoglycoside phosphotransferase [Betaproteobacteria bacterium RBG_16_64_18]|nr:MAG: aminoglycoside phosphotransferase [Betaproteobacteria bacterium RBG_16_64_18]OGA07606.1 MAG: aminoglycoside phosphotransferase [Betaproteobacteria bacterium RIFCSPLOWO2_02_FULL_65_20]OGA44026.1 MAG: aminoglycoside phosphotransferase [Betaproteobacteria bacterium RIFCSPLOWO2_12_FULL_65_110]